MRTKNLEDVYKLSPMQQGMLFHTLYEPQAGEYVVQFTFTLEGKLSIPHLEQAWQEVVNRHPALRTSFQWKGLEKPLQVVHRQLTVVIERHDWRDTAVDQRRERLERFLSEDRCRGFDVTKAPLMRLVLMELGGGVFYFLWSHHHLLLDGWSLPLVFREVLACYEAFSRGRSLALPQPRPYREFISWLQQQDGTGAEHFWRRALAGISGPTPLGIDRPASGDPDEEKTYGEHRWWLDEATTAALLAQARRCSLTPNTLLQGAWALLLSRYSRAGEVLFGIAVAGRPAALPGVESMVGMFINTLPARVRVAEIAPCLAWLREMQDRQLDARQHEHVPLMDIHAWSEVPRGTPLLESLLVYENFPVPTSLHQGDGELEVRDVQFMDMSNFPLTIKATPGARLRLRCVFDRTRIDPEPALRLLGHLGTLLGEMATDLERPLAELSHLTPPEWHQVLVEWNDSRVGWNADRCLHDLIREQVERTPETVAVCFEGEQLTYRELNDRANQLAHRLRALGVGRDGLVGVCLERSLELVVALLGILKAGGAYVPLDPEYPRERLAYIIEDCGASAVLVGPGWEGALPAPVLALERGGGDLAAESTSEPAGGATPSSLAYVIYTSGSTGRPKGVMNSHRGIVNRLFWMQQAYGLDASDRVIQKTPFTFDVSVWEFFWPLLTGARLVVARPGGHKELAYLVDRMVDEGVTTLHFVPSMLRIFLEEPDLERCASLRRVICSGEALPPDLVRAFHERLHAELHNLYGPTEAAVDVTAWPCPPDVAAMIPIGRPIANTAIYLLAGGHPVPIGVPGELFIGGLPPARGYVANPALTSASFVPDAWSGEAGARAYRTGDLARYLPDGSIEYLGRLDHQVKIRGFRIELGEIERVLGEHAAVRDAAVVVRGEGGGEKRLAAFFVAAQGARPAAGELRAFLAERLPDYMLPSLFVQLDALPLTTSGKVDRRALVALEEPAPEAERPYIPPRTPIEEVVAGLWASALGLERVGVEDNFLDLGGNSLLAMRLIASIRQVFEVQLPFRVLFRTPTVAGVSAHIEKMRQEGRGLQPLPMTRIARDGDLPLSFAQQRLWFLDQWEPGSPFYNMALPLRVRSRLSPAVLERSLGEIVRRHEILRTTFAAGPQGPVQVIAPFSGFALPLVDLSSLPAPARRRTARHLAQAEMGRPFQLDRGPLFRALLIRMESELHFLVVATHHIVFDGSVPVFLRELLALYGAFAAGRPSPLAEPAFQYADFAAWQRNWLQGEVLEAQLRYWREQLAGCDEPLELPADRPRPAVQTFGGAVRSFALPRSLSEAIQLLVRREGVTTHMALLAAFKTLLFRYTERQDLSVGSPAQDRPCPEVEGLIGSFTNTLVLRTKLSGDLGFRELLARVREVSLGAYTYQDLPFEMVVESLQPHRSLSHTPLFQVMFVFLNAPVEAASRRESSGLDLSIVSFDRETARFDLLLTVSESHEGLFGVLEYRTDLFDGVTIARLGEHWVRLLEGAVEDPRRRLLDLPLLSDGERAQLIREWNDTAGAFPTDILMHELFEAQAERSPERVAVLCAGQEWSYGELDARTDRLARYLQSLGVGPGSLVGVHLSRSAEMVLALLGVLKAGGAYVPLETSYPEARLHWILERLGIEHVLTQHRHTARLLELGPLPELRTLLCLDEEGGGDDTDPRVVAWSEIAALSAGPPERLGDPDDPAYIIFTSGSTGSPKGVLVRHRPAVNLIDWVNGRFAMGESDRVLFLTSLSFDLSVYDVFGLLAAGGSVRVALEEEVGNPEALVRILETEPITFWDSAPAALQQLVPFFPAASRSHHLRLVFQSGDWIPVGLPDQVRAAFPGAQVISLGGATEATVWSNVFPIESVDRRWVSIPYGRPIRNARYHVLDRELNPCPVGVAGDLYIGGGCLSWGYFGEPELTARKFIPDPFAQSPGDVLYATGDRARSWKDGNLEFLGRLDHQVKIRGFRIELGEIESTLAAHPAVRDAVILAREDNPGDKRLVAYVVPEGRLLEETSLRAFVRERLPRYMEPAAFVVLEHLPTTPNGKVDRKALPPPGRAEGSPEGLEVSGPIEELLAGMWCEVLGIGRAGRHDNFFELGGESLKATQLVSRVRQVFRVELPVRGFFEDPTIAGVARAIQDLWTAAQGRHAREIPPVRTARRDLPLPLSFAQERLWFLDQFAPGSPVYNVASALQLDGPLSIPVFAESLDQIVRRHEILRTTFGLWEGRPVQHITPPARFPLPLLDLGDLPAALQEREAARLAGEEARRSFDLASGPLLRVTLLRLSAARHMMLLTMHHIVSDGWSMWVAIREVAALYRAFLDGRPSPLPPMALQYADFAQWQRAWLDGEVLETQLAYWKERLDGAPQALELPSDRPRPAVPSFRGGREPFALSPELSAELAALGRRRGSTVFMTLLAGFQVLLSRYSGQEDLVVGTAIANRNRQELEGLIGFFVNSLALRANLSGAPGAEELLDRVRESALGAYAHQDVPFERVVDALQLERHLSRPPLFQVMFTLDAAAGEGGLELPGLSLRQIGVGTTTSKFDLTLALVEGRQGLAGTLIYSRDLFDPGTVQRLGEHLRNLLEGIAAQPNVPLERLPLLGVSERQQVLVEWNRSSFDDTRSTCLHELIAQVAVRQPDEPAVLVETGCLTYGELERRAERVARRLSALSVGPEDRVGVCFERSPDMVVALLGVLKAGAAYLPLDPSYPESRLRFMLADSGTRVALTDQARNWLAEAPGLRTIRLDGSADVEPGSAGRVPTRPLPGNLAYVIYTSGSTGQPKGVMISHRNVCNRLLYAAETGQVGAGDRVLQKASISFDLSILEIFAPLVAGGATVLARPGGQLDTAYLADFIAEQRVTHAFFTPSLLQSLLAEPGISRCTSLRAVSSSAEAISVDLQRRFADTLQARLFNRYGPTETSISVASWTCEPDSRERSVPIGRPMAGARLHVLDRKLAPVPVGVAGELYIAGVCLGRGYLGRGDLTAESFLPNPLAEAEGERLYRTGDLARYRADGNLEFLGRIDHQVKIRGLRIELGEIEAVLEQHPGVHEALVLAREDSAGEKRLAAYWVAEPGAAPEERELPAYLAERLPAYMVPASFVRLSAFPLSPNGKIDRTALPDPRDEMRLERGSEAAGTPEEEVVSGIWCDLLGRDRVGLDDSFFALGGHSLLATQAIARLRQAFQVDLPLRDIFEAPTVRGLAQRVALARRSGAGLPLATIPRVPRTGELPLSFGQRRLWFFQRMHPTDPAYNIPIAVRLSGALHVAALGAALREIVRRHEVLRTAFREVEGAPVLAISPRCEPDLPLIDLGGLSRDRQEAEARRLAELEARRPFDLAVAPLLRTTLLRLGGEGHLALFTMHHIASDGGSTEILLRELGLLYRAFTDRRPSPLPELALQYADFAAWQAQSLRGEARERQLAYWQRQLHGAPDLLQMPLDRPRPAVQRQRGANEPFLLPDALYADLKALSRREDVSLFMTLLAAFKALLWRHSGQEDLVVGTSIANRSRPEVQGLVGFFVNNLALRTSLAGDPSFLELLGRVRSVTLGAYAHQDLPFDLLVDALGVPHRPSHTPLFQVQFLFQSIPGERKRLADLGLSRFAVGSPTAKYDLTLNIVEEAGGLTGALNYNTDLFLPATVRRMAEQLQALLEEVASDPARPLSVLTAGGPAAWEGMLGDFNADFSEEIHAV